jgi:hypothetical protein
VVLRRIVTLASLMLISTATPHKSSEPVERSLAVGTTFKWHAADYKHVVRLRSGDLHITITPRRGGFSIRPIVTVSAPGSKLVTLSKAGPDASDLYDNLRVTVGRWDRAGHLFVMLTSYSGGAHCCTLLRLAAPIGASLKPVEFDEMDGDFFRVPRDLDGDGRLDFVIVDQGFLYAFTSYAASYAPPRVYNVTDRGVVDVSSRPSFAPLFRRDMAAAGKACMDRQNSGRNGACAAYVADAARLGQFDQAWKVMLRSYDRNSSWELPPACLDIHLDGTCLDKAVVHYNNYPDSLRAFLKGFGYIRR